jgi:hypothetical protein
MSSDEFVGCQLIEPQLDKVAEVHFALHMVMFAFGRLIWDSLLPVGIVSNFEVRIVSIALRQIRGNFAQLLLLLLNCGTNQLPLNASLEDTCVQF